MSYHINIFNFQIIQSSPTSLLAQVITSESGSIPMIIYIIISILLLISLVALFIYHRKQIEKLKKKVKFAEYKVKDIHKKLKVAQNEIKKLETNPDLIHSREFNLDYLRMRMDDDEFNQAILSQIKNKVKDIITMALRSSQSEQGKVGVAGSSARQIDEKFEITYETGQAGHKTKRVLFRIQIKLLKVPTQPTSQTVEQIITCLEYYLNPSEENDRPPTIQGRLVKILLDEKAKPTPLLVLEQSNDGSNVIIR